MTGKREIGESLYYVYASPLEGWGPASPSAHSEHSDLARLPTRAESRRGWARGVQGRPGASRGRAPDRVPRSMAWPMTATFRPYDGGFPLREAPQSAAASTELPVPISPICGTFSRAMRSYLCMQRHVDKLSVHFTACHLLGPSRLRIPGSPTSRQTVQGGAGIPRVEAPCFISHASGAKHALLLEVKGVLHDRLLALPTASNQDRSCTATPCAQGNPQRQRVHHHLDDELGRQRPAPRPWATLRRSGVRRARYTVRA